jgi:hypothetical protein
MALWTVFMINEISILVSANPIYLYFYDLLQLIYANFLDTQIGHISTQYHISIQSA